MSAFCIAMLLLSTLHAAELPDPFLFNDGHRVKSAADWEARRAELVEQILTNEYGHLPPAPKSITGTLLVTHRYKTLGTEHRVYRITCDPGNGHDKVVIDIDILFPHGPRPFPVILRGDMGWEKTPQLVAQQVLDRGYLLADFNRCEVAADPGANKSDTTSGLFAAYPNGDFGTIAAWAWAYQRCVDFLLTLPDVDKDKIAITGHSRGGKTVLLAGALDPRIAVTVPNCSGCGGAGCFRFQGPQSETIQMITSSFPSWFTPKFKQFIDHEDELPFDQHCLKALVAPRALLSNEALDDLHANPSGTLQTHLAAREVYKFLGHAEKIGIYFRYGIHEQNLDDWTVLLDFADQLFFDKEPRTPRDWNDNPFKDQPKAFSWTAPTDQR